MASTVSGTQNTALRSMYAQLVAQLQASGGSPLWSVDDFIAAAGTMGIQQASSQMGQSGVGWNYDVIAGPGSGGVTPPTGGTPPPSGGTVPGPPGTGGFAGSQADLFRAAPKESQWLQKLQDLGIAGPGMFAANPAESFARSSLSQRLPEFNLQSLATGPGMESFMQWQPGATPQLRQQGALANWQSLVGGADPSGLGEFTAMQDPAAGMDFKPMDVYNMALSARPGALPPFMQRFAENQGWNQYNRFRQQGAQQGSDLPGGWADYLSRQFGL